MICSVCGKRSASGYKCAGCKQGLHKHCAAGMVADSEASPVIYCERCAPDADEDLVDPAE